MMLKTSYIITLLSGIGVFNSCTGNFINFYEKMPMVEYQTENSVYGNYLAGKVAHVRQDYDKAVYYYEKTIEKGMVNEDLLGKTYIILASQGKIDEAVPYATRARDAGDKNNFIDVILATHAFKHGEYEKARTSLKNIKEKTYKNLVSPLFYAWSYAGENNYKNTFDSIKKIAGVEELKTVYNLHSGLLAEKFDKPDEAASFYDEIVNDKDNNMSFRALQIITNFYVRTGKREQAENLVSKYYGSNNMKEMLSALSDKIKASKKNTAPIVQNINEGVAEVFLEVALLFKSVPSGYDYAQMYMAISEYFNPNNDITKIAMADIFEERELPEDANKYYDSIAKDSELYYTAQMKKANNLLIEDKKDEAISVLKKLLRNNPKNFQVLFNLGDAFRMNNDQTSAIKYYNEAIDAIFYESEKYWPVYYALAVSYDKNNEWPKAEKSLEKALKLSNRHPQVLNYLGYSWLKYDINADKATQMIVEAYEKNPNDGVIMDSLGWVYFKTGDYDKAINYLEKASELNPQNAVITDHLGDAYWFGGRKNEAVFQWKRALKQEDSENELNPTTVKNKIRNGLKKNSILTLKDEQISQSLQQLEEITN
jgi:tetratricopeptide (TPR) repeat protein